LLADNDVPCVEQYQSFINNVTSTAADADDNNDADDAEVHGFELFQPLWSTNPQNYAFMKEN